MAEKAVLMQQVKRILREQSYYQSAGALMGWDLWQGLSEDGRPFRSEVSGYFTRKARGTSGEPGDCPGGRQTGGNPRGGMGIPL